LDSEPLISVHLLENCIFCIVVRDPDHSTHDLENVISVIVHPLILLAIS